MSDNIEELRIKVEMLRPLYDKCVLKEEGNDPEWEIKKKALFSEILREANGFQKDGTGAGAAYILGKIAVRAAELEAHVVLLWTLSVRIRNIKKP